MPDNLVRIFCKVKEERYLLLLVKVDPLVLEEDIGGIVLQVTKVLISVVTVEELVTISPKIKDLKELELVKVWYCSDFFADVHDLIS